jgi:hypothetical protein
MEGCSGVECDEAHTSPTTADNPGPWGPAGPWQGGDVTLGAPKV